MARFARLESGEVREVISRPAAFKIAKAYHPELISAGLGGTAQAGDGFVPVPVGATVKEGYVYDQAAGTFAAPAPAPAAPKPVDVVSELVDVLVAKGGLAMADFSADARAEITTRKARRR